jgi:hypothetical protein
VVLPLGGESVASTRKDLVSICLVPHIPDNLVKRRVEAIVEGEGEFYAAEVRGKMTPGLCNGFYEKLSNFSGKKEKITFAQLFQIAGGVYCVEKLRHVNS